MEFSRLKEAIRQKYAFGGYEIVGITSDGGLLCCDCMRKEFKNICWSIIHNVSNGWKVEAIDCTANMEGLNLCDHCGKTITEEEN